MLTGTDWLQVWHCHTFAQLIPLNVCQNHVQTVSTSNRQCELQTLLTTSLISTVISLAPSLCKTLNSEFLRYTTLCRTWEESGHALWLT
jgi:hypothetical protein